MSILIHSILYFDHLYPLSTFISLQLLFETPTPFPTFCLLRVVCMSMGWKLFTEACHTLLKKMILSHQPITANSCSEKGDICPFWFFVFSYGVFYLHICVPCKYVCLVSLEARRKCQIPWKSYRPFWVTLWVLEIEPGSFRTACSLSQPSLWPQGFGHVTCVR